MKNKLFIPDTIHIGYNERKDTYTGKLAYVIYTDNKGVKRKENSWESWRNKTIKSDDYENKPTEGFVLNKGVGGVRQSYGWNPRNEYIRVYDPRGFEFEITVANLLYILQECTSTKGKGLEGQFVYSWQGKDLVLLPVSTSEYKESLKFSDVQSNKVSARDLKIGCTYLSKQLEEYVYMGRFKWYQSDSKGLTEKNGKKQHIFYGVKNKKFVNKSSMAFLSNLANEESVDNYADLMDEFNKTKYASVPAEFSAKSKKMDFYNNKNSYWYSIYGFLKVGENRFARVELTPKYEDKSKFSVNRTKEYEIKEDGLNIGVGLGIKQLNDIQRAETTSTWNRREIYYPADELEKLEWLELKIKTKIGALIEADKYENYYSY